NGVLYQFWVKDVSTNKWKMIQDYSKSSARWTPTKPGKYLYGVHIKDEKSNQSLDAHLYKEITIDLQINYTSYSYSLKHILDKQMKVNPQTDYYNGNWQLAEEADVKYFLNPDNFNKDRVSALIINTNVDPLSVRTLPSLTGLEITKVPKGATYAILEQKNGWYKIIANGTRIGWVSGDYVKLTTIENDQKFQFLDLSKVAGISVQDLNNILSDDKGNLENTGSTFIQASKTYSVNEIYLVSHALLETGNGKSDWVTGILVDANGELINANGDLIDSKGKLLGGKGKTPYVTVYNMFGIGAVDSDPKRLGAKRAFQEGWTSVEKAIVGGAKFVSESYINHATYKQNTLYKMRWNPGNNSSNAAHQYASDIAWAYKQIRNIKRLYDVCNDNYILYFDIPKYN
ncbi:SH3 domain-containing protein, partial [Alkalibaculum sp. M08DMB]